MIATFADKDTAALAEGRQVRRFQRFADVARRKLRMIEAAATLEDLRVPPGNRLEALKGDRQGQHSIRINQQWRVCFVWRNNKAHEVEIVDYHG
jgi:proteic killer suppression protein